MLRSDTVERAGGLALDKWRMVCPCVARAWAVDQRLRMLYHLEGTREIKVAYGGGFIDNSTSR